MTLTATKTLLIGRVISSWLLSQTLRVCVCVCAPTCDDPVCVCVCAHMELDERERENRAKE